MTLQENKDIVRRFVEEMQNQHNPDLIDEMFSPDFVDYSGRANPPTREGVRPFFAYLFNAFPDLRFEIQQQLAEGDRVMTYKVFYGTHLGDFMGIPPTGKQVVFDNIDIFTVKDGKLAAHWTVGDHLSLMQQLGVIPAPTE
ncbi:MAG: ester cyclase [Chloroflexi bacterium]|nr:ester cyclase [Chloroflexota bacterium]